MSKLLRLRKHNPYWKDEFLRIKQYLKSFLPSNIDEIYHIGSTSIPGIWAKPIIDIDIVYTKELSQIKEALTANGYIYEGEKGIPDRHSFKYTKSGLYEHHLYAVLKGSIQHKNHFDFKRGLLHNQEFREQYSLLKQELVNKNRFDRNLYTESKTEFISKVIMEERKMKTIVFAGGCFWGVEAYFKQLDGVTYTEVGYINGEGHVTYQEVCRGSGHTEAVLIRYDEDVISLKKLLDHLFNIIDPTTLNRQGPDVGMQYRTGIYNYQHDELPFIQNYIAVRQREYKKKIVLELVNDLPFYRAEHYHQDYLDKNPNGYCHVNLASHKNVE